MRLLLDSCVWGGARSTIEAAGHDVVWAGDWEVDPGDDEILSRSHAEKRILVTLDKDFGELAIVQGRPHSGFCGWSAFPLGDRQWSAFVLWLSTASSLRQGRS